MEIPNEHIPTIKESLRQSIRKIQEYHENLRSEYYKQGRTWDYDEEISLKPVRDALKALP